MSVLTAAPAPAAPTPPPLLTAGEFFRRYGHRRCELVRGRVVELAMPGLRHGKVCMRVGVAVANWADANDAGHVACNDTLVQTGAGPDTVRGPDVAFFSYERVPRGEVPEGVAEVAPDLAVEVKSPTNTWTELFTKVVEYLLAGSRAVLILDPVSRTASVYRPEVVQQMFQADDELTIPDVLPGFSARVRRLFE